MAHQVAVVGSTGLIGMQLVRLLNDHPHVGQIHALSDTLENAPFSSLHPSLRHLADVRLQKPTPSILQRVDTVFVCKGADQFFGSALAANERNGRRVIDLTDTHRIGQNDQPSRFFNALPEINGDSLFGSEYISMQGCVPTVSILALWPLLKAGILANSRVIIDAKVSSSGAGLSSKGYSQLHFNRSGGVRAYKLHREHRHALEIEEFLHAQSGVRVSVSLNVFSVDIVRGISVAIYLSLKEGVRTTDLRRLLSKTYRGRPFVRLTAGSPTTESYPNPKWLVGTNICEIGIHLDEETGHCTVVTAADNLIRGGAGQAIQAFNLANGYPEGEALSMTCQYP